MGAHSGCHIIAGFDGPIDVRIEDHPDPAVPVVHLAVSGSHNVVMLAFWWKEDRGGDPRQALTAIRDACQAWLGTRTTTPASAGEGA